VIYLDVSSAVHGKAGLSRYAESLAHALAALLGPRLGIFQNSLGRRGPLGGWEAVGVSSPPPTIGVPYGYRAWRAAVLARSLLRLTMDRQFPGAELFHATEHLLPPLRHIPTALTVHDLVWEHFPQYHKAKNYLYLRTAMPLYCARASAIIAISESTKGDLAARLGIAPEKITVIPEAAAPHFGPQPPELVETARARYALPGRYLVTVGTIEPRKNLARLVDACGPLFAEDLVDALVVVGNKGWLYEGFFRHLAACPWRDRVILPGFVPDTDLPAVYAGAMLTVQPSLYEGFGLPVLEAMACGCPVCASNASSLPEVGGDAAAYFRPEETEDITACLRRVLSDEATRRDMAQRGLQRSARYSWAATATATMRVYERVLGETLLSD